MTLFVHRSTRSRLALVCGLAIAMTILAHATAVAKPAALGPDDARDVLAARESTGFALVVGSNATADESGRQRPLRYADDDAARMTELLQSLGYDVELVTRFDQDSQSRFADLVGKARGPTPEGLRMAFADLQTRMREANDRGETVEFTFYYSGHGDVGPDGNGYLTLEGGVLHRSELFTEILGQSIADFNHVLLDACQSEQFVEGRGPGAWQPDRLAEDVSQLVERYLDRTQLSGFPTTGVVLAHSADQQTHEWERYQGGVFSHELLSGLQGGADLNGDGRVEYSELGAFVSAANSAVKDPRAHLDVTVHPPRSDERRPLVVHRNLALKRVLLFGERDDHAYVLEDERGVRIADLRRSAEAPGYLRLPAAGRIFVSRSVADDAEPEEAAIAADRSGIVFAADLEFAPSERRARGAVDVAFRQGLFATAFGPGYYAGYTDRNGLLPVRDPAWQAELWPTSEASSGESPVSPRPNPPAESHGVDERRRVVWGGVQLGTVVTPFNSAGVITDGPQKLNSDRMRGCLAPEQSLQHGCTALRGFDLRWQLFTTRANRRYPRWMAYFRTGYTAGYAAFEREGGAVAGDALALSYFSVPLFVGGNAYVFDRFPVRPYGGLGAGFDVVRVAYDRFDQTRLTRARARIGFELHAGLEARITNTVALTAEVMQLWSLRMKMSGVPDFTNTGLTVITAIAIGFPLYQADQRPR